MLFDRWGADFAWRRLSIELLELGLFSVEAIDVVFGCHLSSKIRDVVLGRHFAFADAIGSPVSPFTCSLDRGKLSAC
jgi:hypothetical protein